MISMQRSKSWFVRHVLVRWLIEVMLKLVFMLMFFNKVKIEGFWIIQASKVLLKIAWHAAFCRN